MKSNQKKYALISTFDKKNLNFLCQNLKKNNISIISTGSTSDFINKNGFKCFSISSLTKFKEILDGRVKTLHPKLYASILYKRNNKDHLKTFKNLKFPSIEFVIVNLYPFEKVSKKKNNIDESIEMIDIGGPALLRSAAKNYNNITAICNINDYKNLTINLNQNKGSTSLEFRKKMAMKVFKTTSLYDLKINEWFLQNYNKNYSNKKNIKFNLRYGENPNQKAKVIFDTKKGNYFDNKIQGKELSYNNILDIDAAINCLSEFSETTCVIVKHNNPCGVAIGKNNLDSFKKALSCDEKSAFGGIVAFNKPIELKVAKILNKKFFEIIISPNFSSSSKKELSQKKKLILIKNIQKINKKDEIKSINNGYLQQQQNSIKINKKNISCVSKKKASLKQINDLIFALKISKHVKSNALVLAKNLQTIGIGAGQMSRIDSTKIALLKSKKHILKKNFIAASDAFFPFNDSAKLLIKNNCIGIIQPSGSVNDKNMILFVNEKKISLYFSKYRLFKH